MRKFFKKTEQLNEKIADASKTIFSYCMARTPDRAEAEDLCQDILCELVRSSANLRDSRVFRQNTDSLHGLDPVGNAHHPY